MAQDKKMPDMPISVTYQNLKITITDAIRQSGLPAWMLLDMMAVITTDIRDTATKQMLQDARDYDSAMAAWKGGSRK